MTNEPGTLSQGEPHPSAFVAKEWIANQESNWLWQQLEVMSSVALSGNRLAEVCAETLRRLLSSQPVSDRYLLGLAWFLKDLQEQQSHIP